MTQSLLVPSACPVAALDLVGDALRNPVSSLLGGPLVDQRSTHVVVPHSDHQVPRAYPRLRCPDVARVTEIVEVQPPDPDRADEPPLRGLIVDQQQATIGSRCDSHR